MTGSGRLAGKVALITGAGDGMGRAAALLFAQEGARVAVLDIDGESAVATVSEIHDRGGRALALAADVADAEAVARSVDETVEEFGSLNVLYNNAGVWEQGDGPLVDVDPVAWARTLAVNLTGAFHTCRVAIPKMIEAGGGSIINTSSPAAMRPELGSAAYVASKGGMASLTLAIAQDYAKDGIRANTLMPGIIDTTLVADALADPEHRAYCTRVTPLGRIGQPEDVAKAALFLASDDALFVTGGTLWADGGWQIGGRTH